MNELMNSPCEEGLLEDELKSIRSKLTNTTKMMSSKYRKRSKATKVVTTGAPSSNLTPSEHKVLLKDTNSGSKFSVIFVG
jgi:hypothetical protein